MFTVAMPTTKMSAIFEENNEAFKKGYPVGSDDYFHTLKALWPSLVAMEGRRATGHVLLTFLDAEEAVLVKMTHT